MTFRKRRVSASRYGGNDIDDPLWIVLVAVSSAIMKRVGAGGYKGLLPTEMNALYSEVPGAPNYNEEGFRSMFYHEIDEPVLPNQRPSDIGLATKYGLQRSGLYFAAKFYDLEAFKKSFRRIPTSVQDKLKRDKEDGGYGLDIRFLKSFFSGANHFVRRSDLFKLFLKHKKIGKEQLRGDIQNAILATTKKSERRRLKGQLADMSDDPTSEECSSDGSDRPSPEKSSKVHGSSRSRHRSSSRSSRRRHSDSDESDEDGARRPPRSSKSMKKHSSSSRRRRRHSDSEESDGGGARRSPRPSKAGSSTGYHTASASQTYDDVVGDLAQTVPAVHAHNAAVVATRRAHHQEKNDRDTAAAHEQTEILANIVGTGRVDHTEALRGVDPSVLGWAMRTCNGDEGAASALIFGDTTALDTTTTTTSTSTSSRRHSGSSGGSSSCWAAGSSSSSGVGVAPSKQKRTRKTDPKLGLVTASGRSHGAGDRENEDLLIPEHAHGKPPPGLGAPDIKGASNFQQLDAALGVAAAAAGGGGAGATQVSSAAVATRSSFSRIASQLGSGSAGMTAADFVRVVAGTHRGGSGEQRFLLSMAGELSGTAVARSSGAAIVGAGSYSQYRAAVDDSEKQQGYGGSGGAGHVSAVERQKQNSNALLHLAAGASGAHLTALHLELAKMPSLDASTLDDLSSEIEEPPPRIGQPVGRKLVKREDLTAGMIFEEQMSDGSGFSGNNYIEKGILYTVVGRLRGDLIYDHGEEYDHMSNVLFVLKHCKGETVAKKLKDSTKSSATNSRFNGAIEHDRKSYHGQPHYDGSCAERLIPIPGFTAETAAEASNFIKHDQVTGEAEVGWYEWSPEAFKELRYYDWHLAMPTAAATAASSSSSSSSSTSAI